MSRSTSWIVRTASIVAIAWSIFQLYTAGAGFFHVMVQRPIHLGFALALTFLTFPLFTKTATGEKAGAGKADVAFALISVLCVVYLLIDQERVIQRVIFVDDVRPLDIAAGLALIFLCLEAGRRTLGLTLSLFAIAFIAYLVLGPYFPIGALAHGGISLERFIDLQILAPQGIFGMPIGVSTDTVFYFLLFAAFLEESGGGKLFTDVAFWVTGRMRGGSAKTAVVGSSLMGTISGSAVANVVADGVFTISMMKRTGFKGDFAAAVEAVASTGGQIMPPVMGAGAFVMAAMLGVPYWEIVKAAIIPAVGYYFALFVIVDRKAKKDGLRALSAAEMPKLNILPKLHLVIPLAVLIYLIMIGRSLMIAGTLSIITILPVSLLRAGTRMGWKKILLALDSGARQAVSAAIPCAIAGIIIGAVVYTGLGLRLSSYIVHISEGNVLLAMALVMACCIVLGMGMPTTAAYIIAAAVMVPALIQLGIVPIAAHMFVFYFACLSMVTPPVALAAYAAAGIAKSDTWKTGWIAFTLAVGGFVVPFAFAQNPALLLQIKSMPEFIWLLFTTTIGIFSLSAAIIYLGPPRFSWLFRPAYVVAGFLLVDPGITTDIIGFVVLGVVWLTVRFSGKAEVIAARADK